MISSQKWFKLVAKLTLFATVANFPVNLPVLADSQVKVGNGLHAKNTVISQLGPVTTTEAPLLIAQTASCATCGAELDPLLLLSDPKRPKDKSLLTDSLWGNLILEMAYQRDKELQRIAKKMNIVSLGTLTSIGAIAGGTLAQGIVAMEVLNPSEGHQDSYTPGIIGTVLSSATILTFMSRFYFNHRMQSQIQNRQLAIKHKVEAILAHMEHSDAGCSDAKKQLTELIGPRATNEWVQLWHSSHQVAMAKPNRITLLNMPGHSD